MGEARVLVVEPDKSLARMLSLALYTGGFRVTVASHNLEALRLLNEELFSAVVLDLGLPDTQGSKILRLLQRDPKMNAVAWVAVSTIDAEDIRRMYGPLDGHFVSKPLDPWDLVKRLKV